MSFRFEKTPVDLQDTPIENLFLDLYMPIAPSDYVKVYLLGVRYALENTAHKNFSSKTIADNLNLPVDLVHQAWDYWEEKGLVRRLPSAAPDEESGVEFVSLKALHFRHVLPNSASQAPSGAEQPASFHYEAGPSDLIQAQDREEYQAFFRQIDHYMKRSLVPHEQMQVLNWLQHFKLEREVVLLAFEYATRQKQVYSLPYVAGIIRNWSDEGLSTAEAVRSFLDRMQLRYRQYDQVFKTLGFHGRLPSEEESRLIDAWLDEWSFSMEMILKACRASANTPNPSIRYIHSILERWHQQGLDTPEAVDRHEQQRKDNRGRRREKESSAASGQKKTGFHLPESRGKDYTNEDLERILLGRKRRPRKEDT